MKKHLLYTFVFILFGKLLLCAQGSPKAYEPSFFKFTTSNGMIVSVYNTLENRIDYVYPHIFANYDSGIYVHPFTGNIVLAGGDLPLSTSYVENTHVISSQYKDFTVNYFASFTNHDKIFYIVVRGSKQKIENLNFKVESGDVNIVSGITQIENPLEDLPLKISGNMLTGTLLRQYNKDTWEKYFLYSFTDLYHRDPEIINKELLKLKKENKSLLDAEVNYMKQCFARCIIPKDLSAKEKNVVEQSISILKMAQVSDYEIFPASHGQILASLRPGLWHTAWVRDGSFAIQAMTRLGMYDEARKAIEFMLKAPSGNFKHYIYKDGKDYGTGVDYQISLTRFFGNGKEECDYNDFGPNIEFDDFGLFLCAYCDYVTRSKDEAFHKKWNKLMCDKVADATVQVIDANGLIREDSGPWEHHLEMPRQYTFTSGVCARGLELFAQLQQKCLLPYEKYLSAAESIRKAILDNMLVDGRYIKGNVNDQSKTTREYYDAGVSEIFANGLISNKSLFLTHMEEYDKVLRIKGERPGYIRLNTVDPYENQEWVFIDLRIALAQLIFGNKPEAAKILNYITEQASFNHNTIPEMFSNKLQMDKVTENFKSSNIWCNCIRDKDDQFIGEIPMVGYGSAAYILTLYAYHEK
ncbi:MAG: hypothetical protein HXX13_09750 [Bacteroidetes bacterium]|nr:hypothetical protein [Bacteroidota bacterium]